MAPILTSGTSDDRSDVTIQGTPVVPGVAFGPAVWMQPRPVLPGPGELVGEGARQQEFEDFLRAAEAVRRDLGLRADAAIGTAAELLQASTVMVADPAWHRAVRARIAAGHRAEYAVVIATEKFLALLEKAGGVVSERVADLADIRDRVLAQIMGIPAPGLPELTEPAILVVDDLAPVDAVELNPAQVKALLMAAGGRTGHTAIIARQLNIPCVVGLGGALATVRSGDFILVDAVAGTVATGVDSGVGRAAVAQAQRESRQAAHWQGPGRTRDGHRVKLLASVAGVSAARQAADGVAEGIGLFRSELSFLRNRTEPGVTEQAGVYAELLAAFPERRVVIRTFDAGSDKPLAFADPGSVDSSALGIRGIRINRTHAGLIQRQLDAIALAAAQLTERGIASRPWVMAPMIATVGEVTWFATACRERGLVPGAMIEVPAAALMADRILPQLEFVSIGTNDLTQYTMAADRLSARLADLSDPWQPAVLRLIRQVCQQGEQTRTRVGVCGESAADPLLACVMVGLGVVSLAPAAGAIAGVGQKLSTVDLATCRQAAAAVLSADDAADARAVAAQILRVGA